MANETTSDSTPKTTVAPANNKPASGPKLSPDIEKLLQGRLHDPFTVLGRHAQNNADLFRVFLPHAEEVYLADLDESMTRVTGTDLFEWTGARNSLPKHCRIEWYDADKNQHAYYDPYCFEPQLSDFDLHLFGEGKHWHAYNMLGAHKRQVDGIDGVLFAVWAPNAQRISVIAEFNQWDGRCHPMRSRGGSGIWELFIPEIDSGALYKFEIIGQHGEMLIKADPYGQAFEMRPSNASIVCDNTPFLWQDQDWLESRQNDNWLHEPQSVYEVHLGSWQRDSNGKFLNYVEVAERLVAYVIELGFTHIQLLPLTEHPLDASWGYQTTGYFAPTSRFGTPDEFRYFVNHCHSHGIGVIMDWVPAHFPKDAHALARFDGTALYEHEDPRRGEHRDWGTYIYNYGRNEVRNLLLSSAFYWLEEFHIDGLRVDAVASMLYLDYSREAGDWVPNMYGGNENLEAIDFLRQLNEVIHGEFPGCMVIAEESTAWPQVTRPTWIGGLGFSMKWNMGWMHDSLEYFKHDPVHRQFHHDQLTFGLLYAFTENFVLPLSHDEVVHGKGSILNRMPGDDWQRFANLRLLYTYMFVYPGKKLLFMGCEFAQPWEWNFDDELPWHLMQYAPHQGMRNLITDANKLYRDHKPLHKYDFDVRGFEWVDCHDAGQSIISFIRRDDDNFIIAAFNFTPVPRHAYRLGVPEAGIYEEILNSDSEHYNGSNIGNLGEIQAEDTPWMGRTHSISLTLPPLAGIVLRRRAAN